MQVRGLRERAQIRGVGGQDVVTIPRQADDRGVDRVGPAAPAKQQAG
jgi:hypothetical protein